MSTIAVESWQILYNIDLGLRAETYRSSVDNVAKTKYWGGTDVQSGLGGVRSINSKCRRLSACSWGWEQTDPRPDKRAGSSMALKRDVKHRIGVLQQKVSLFAFPMRLSMMPSSKLPVDLWSSAAATESRSRR